MNNKLRIPGWIPWIFFLFAISPSTLNAQYLKEVWQMNDWGYDLGSRGSYVTDLDGDGINEIVFTSQIEVSANYSYIRGSRFFVLSHTSNGYALSYSSPLFENDSYYASAINWLTIANRDGDDDQEIYVLSGDGHIQVYDGSTLAPVDTLLLESTTNASKMQIVDLDSDGADEIVIIGALDYYSDTYLKVFDAESLSLEWETMGRFFDFEIGDVDADGSREIVTSDGMILDGVTFTRQWQYADGFGETLELAQTDDDPALEILGYNASRDKLIAFDGEFETPLWEISARYGSSMTTADVDGDGVWEIFIGSDNYNNRLNVYSASTREILWQIENVPRESASMIVGDPDGDGQMELIMGGGYYSSERSRFAIVDSRTGAIEYTNESLGGPFFVQTGNLDGESGNEIVISGRDRTNNYSDDHLTIIYGGVDHVNRWNTDENPDLNRYNSFEGMSVADTDGDERHELVVSQSNQTVALEGWLPQTLWQSTNLRSLRAFASGDLDRDGSVELVVGDGNGQVSILRSHSPQVIWRSITTSGQIGGIRLADIDDDDALEITFFNLRGRVHVYDGKTHFLEWQSTEITNATAVDVADLDRDGQKELIVGRQDGSITILETNSFSTVDHFSAADGEISGLRAGNVDDTEMPELLIAASTLKALHWPEKDMLWESLNYGTSLGSRDGLHIADVDQDGYMDVLVAGLFGVVQLESTVRYPDVISPYLRETTPAPGDTLVSRDQIAWLRLSEPIDATALETNLRVRADGADVGFTAGAEMSSVVVSPLDQWPATAKIEITLLGTLTDSAGNGFDGNLNEIADGSPVDDRSLFFFTGTGIDSIGPTVKTLTLNSDSIWSGTKLWVNGLLSDTSSVATSKVAATEYFVDQTGESGTGTSVPAADSLFDSGEEEVMFLVDTDDLSGGEHTLWLHGRDTRGNWGPLAAISFYIITPEGGEWAQYGQNAQHTGFNSRDSIRVPLQLEWNSPPFNGYLTAPIVVGNRIFVSSGSYEGDEKLYALEVETGQEIWSFSFGNISSITMPAFAYGRVYVQSIDHTPGSYVTALDAQTGRREWQSPFGSQWSGGIAPTVADGKVFVNGGYYGGMTTYDAFSGEELWFIDLPQEFGWTPTYYEGTVYSAWDNASYYAIDADNGEMKYRHGTPNYYGYTAVVKDSVLYTTNPLAAIELGTRQVRWSQSASTTPALAYGKVFAVAFGRLHAYDEISGGTLWSFDPDEELFYEPVVANGYVFASSESMTYALDAESGEEAWSYAVGGRLAVANNRLFVSGNDGSLYVFIEGEVTLADDENLFPQTYTLEPNYPNPFNLSTTIPYELPSSGPVRLEVYNALGQKVATLVDEFKAAGRYEQPWDAGSLSSGQYFYRITAGAFTAVRPMALIK